MAITKPAVRAAWADSAVPNSDILDPGTTFTAGGWPLSTTPPARQFFNWILNYCMNGIRYLCRRGVADWDANESYVVGDIVRSDDGLLRRAIAPSTNQAPSGAPTYWDSPLVPAIATPVGFSGTYANKIASMGSVGQLIYGVRYSFSLATAQYFKIATLPASNAGTYDNLQIRATISSNSGWGANQATMVDIIMGNRNGFAYYYNSFGPPLAYPVGIACYQNSNGTTDVYAFGIEFTYVYASIINATQVTLYDNPASMTASQVTGTLVFSTAVPATYPPLLSISSPGGSFVTNAQLTSTLGAYHTIAAFNASIANYYTQSQITSILGGYVTTGALATNLANYHTIAAFNTAIANYPTYGYVAANYYNSGQVNSIVSQYLGTATAAATYQTKAAMTPYYHSALGSGNVTVQSGGSPSGGSPGDMFLIY